MPTMNQGMRGGPRDSGDLRPMGQKTLTVTFDPRAKLYHAGYEVKPQTVYAMDRITAAFFKRGLCVVWTSIVRQPTRKRFSLHPFGYAVDAAPPHALRHEVWVELGHTVGDELGDAYDVLVHNDGSGMHMHAEFDPENDKHWAEWKAGRLAEWEAAYAQVREA